MSFLKKLVNKILNKEEEVELTSVRLGDQLKDADLDYKFAKLFTHAGGYFQYCGDESEVLRNLNTILKLEDVSSAFCCDGDLQNFLDVIKVPYTDTLQLSNDCAVITCEYLIAFDGRVMLSANNIKHFPIASMPNKIVVVGNVSQIVASLSEAMNKVKRRGTVKNLTAVSGNISELSDESANSTKLFLLLLED